MAQRSRFRWHVLALAFLAAACSPDTPQTSVPAASSNSVAEQTDDGSVLKAGVDISIADVALSDVVFDTFDGGSVTLEEATEEQILGLLDAIPPIDSPVYEPGTSSEQMHDDDLVIGFVGDDGSAWAYPHRILNFHEIVNDEIAGVPVVITYCPLCRSGVVFDRRIDDLRHDGVLSSGNSSALYENDLVLIDRETNSYWWQLAGRSIVGRLSGAELPALPSVTTTWAQWLADHPDTSVLSHDQGFGRSYENDPFGSYAGRVDAGQVPFPVGPESFADDRLAPSTRVIGFDAVIDGQPTPHAVPVLSNEPSEFVVASSPQILVRLDGAGGGEVFSVDESGQETPYPSRSSFWFAYVGLTTPTEIVLVGPS